MSKQIIMRRIVKSIQIKNAMFVSDVQIVSIRFTPTELKNLTIRLNLPDRLDLRLEHWNPMNNSEGIYQWVQDNGMDVLYEIFFEESSY